jgi:hypothetical protein
MHSVAHSCLPKVAARGRTDIIDKIAKEVKYETTGGHAHYTQGREREREVNSKREQQEKENKEREREGHTDP